MKLGYARVSTTDQDARMQIAALVEAGVEEKNIFTDHMSGAKTAKERPGLTELLKYARDGDQVYCWRIDRLGRSLIDVLNTVDEMTKRGIALHSLIDGVDPSTPSGRLQLGLFATLAEYERELINERVRFGVMAAQARGVRFGKQPADPAKVENKVAAAKNLLGAGKTAQQAADAVGWSRATLYRYLKEYGAEEPVAAAVTTAPKGRSRYIDKSTLPPRD
ncbi:recombinase family protein [Arthrobacter sp. UYCo732]|uniref:recombinase family protein n=1 Tax=Arthrobacter sp. UYCo732 TaxID=3156336 RepID=UPI003396385A